MELDISNIEFSHQDIKRNIKLPIKLTPELAELVGIITGDGKVHLSTGINSKGKRYFHYQISIFGHYYEDRDYYNNTVDYLFNKLFNINLKPRDKIEKNLLAGQIDSKGILHFLNTIFAFPTTNKYKIGIPKIIINSNNKIIFSFIRGLFDTDGSITFQRKDKNLVHKYPIIKIGLKSKKIIKQLSNLLSLNKFSHCTLYDFKKPLKNKIFFGNNIYISGKKNLKRWMNLINFSNPKHLTKYQIWKKFDFCPPYTTIEERRKILKGEINPYSYY